MAGLSAARPGRQRLRVALRRGGRRLRIGLLVVLPLAAVLAQAGTSLALFTDSQAVGGSTLTTGTWGPWVFYLHNRPTPPLANTTAQVDLAMDGVAPSAATLYRYSTNCAAQRAGRRLNRVAPNPNQRNACRHVNWQTPVLTSPMTLSGTISVDIWSATDTGANNRTGGLVAYVRDFNPAGAGSYTEVANGTLGGTYAAGRTFYHRPIDVTLGAAYAVPAGHSLEIELVASNAYRSNMLVAYDTTAYASFVRVP